MSSIANELITRGWHQGSLHGEDGSVCLGAACSYSAGVTYRVEGRDFADWDISSPEFRAVERVLFGMGYGCVSIWNDEPGRTFDEVLRVAKMADEILDAES